MSRCISPTCSLGLEASFVENSGCMLLPSRLTLTRACRQGRPHPCNIYRRFLSWLQPPAHNSPFLPFRRIPHNISATGRWPFARSATTSSRSCPRWWVRRRSRPSEGTAGDFHMGFIRLVVNIIVLFWVLSILQHLVFRGPKRGP